MFRRLSLMTVLFALVACGEDPGRTDGTDGGTTPADAGISDGGGGDAGGPEDGGPVDTDGGQPPEDGGVDTDAGQPADGGSGGTDAGITVSVDLFELKGKVPSGIGSSTVDVTLFTPFVEVAPNDRVHAFDNRANGLGCYANHFDSSHPPQADVNDGTVTITGYAGGRFYDFTAGSAPSSMVCKHSNGNYVCSYAPYNGAKPVGGQPFGGSTNPLGSGTISFANDAAGFATFNVSGSSTKTLTASGLTSLSFSTTQDLTINYSCSNCSSYLVLVTLAASRNAPNAIPSASASYGSITCAVEGGGSSVTIPKEGIAAMLGGATRDTTLKSVITTVIVATPTSPQPTDSAGNPVNVLVGRGVFGISAL